MWVNPKDSRHVIKLDDGGIGISFDRGLKFLYVQNLPVSQYYRVAVDNERPYNVYGGLQDNGCWKGPSASWTTNGILNEHWSRLCGGDGFFAVPDPTNSRIVFSATQFLGLRPQRHAHVAEPGHPSGRSAGRDRRSPQLEHLGQGRAAAGARQRHALRQLGRAGRALAASIRPRVYAGGKHLFRSRDRGTTWEDLGDMTTGVDRSNAAADGPDAGRERCSRSTTACRIYPGIVSIAPSPLTRGLLYVGTDDGRLRMSSDDGKTWTDLQDRLPGLPKSSWFGGIEASRHDASTVYVAVDNHRSNDLGNYLYKSTRRRQDLHVDRRRPAGRPRGPHGSRGRQEPEPAVRRHRVRAVLLAERRRATGSS